MDPDKLKPEATQLRLTQEQIRTIAATISPNQVCAEILALSIVELTYSQQASIEVTIGTREGQVVDTGRGIRMSPDDGQTISHAERAFTEFHPCDSASVEVDKTLNDLIWRENGAIGPALANFACPWLKFTSVRDSEKWSQSFEFGRPLGAPEMIGRSTATGTEIEFRTRGSIDYCSFEKKAVQLQEAINLAFGKKLSPNWLRLTKR